MEATRLRLGPRTLVSQLARIEQEAGRFEMEYMRCRPQDEQALHAHDEWVYSAQGQAVLNRLGQRILQVIAQYPAGSGTAFDLRHISKGVASAFHIIRTEGYTHDWRSLMLFPCLAHDLGRLAEAQLTGDMNMVRMVGQQHALISFEAFADILREPDFLEIPRALTDEMLYAVLKHRSHEGQNRTMAVMVQRSDREQGAGAENIVRVALYDVGVHGAAMALPDFKKVEFPDTRQEGIDAGYLTAVNAFAAYLYDNAGSDAAQIANTLRAQSLVFVQMASVGHGSSTLNAGSTDAGWDKDPFIRWSERVYNLRDQMDVLAQARALRGVARAKLVQTAFYTPETCRNTVMTVLGSPNRKLDADARSHISARLDELPLPALRALAAGLILTQEWRYADDLRQLSVLKAAIDDEAAPGWQRKLACQASCSMGVATHCAPPVPGINFVYGGRAGAEFDASYTL
ncbi:MAG: hypothetical protein H6865_05975 [Rhodospirillales bacterium]|nr:hypothetical protein [Alphaproteobacteria bacterium]MCB9987170.1 hypothetical protein [Rhodospirillales bacterium]USO07966.1 MAG: hypothetical protein H6866_01725 [Rhodospirillales bacterium]